jgi:signal transduction histidine kinase
VAEALEQAGDAAAAARLKGLVEESRREQEAWSARVEDVLAVHHEINNALVGVRGNTQLMLMNPAGQGPGVRERLEVVLRESGRIQEATARLRDLKGVFGRRFPRPHAA